MDVAVLSKYKQWVVLDSVVCVMDVAAYSVLEVETSCGIWITM